MASVKIDTNRVIGKVDPKLFGHFTEHAQNNIYKGMYDPESPFADEDGFRTDVLEAMGQAGVSMIRWPGGNFVSDYHWEDGVGPKEERRRVFDYAWLKEESNEFGTAEFIRLCRKVGAEPLICLNMGTGTINEAMGWVEYCNGTGDTYYANLRRSHGYDEPFNVKYWGLGNEMYGPWQMNQKSAEDYAKDALQFAKAVKWVDPSIRLIVCGFEQSSDWNYTVMKEAGSLADYISAHHYAIGWGPFDRDYLTDLYIPEYMRRLTDLTLAAAYTGMNTDSDVKVAWDEWNMLGWAVDGVGDDSAYTMHDAVITALILQMFIRNCNKIGMANYSTFVNINGAVSVYEDGIVKRAQYPVFELLANNIGTESYDVCVDSDPLEIKVSQSEMIGKRGSGLQADLTAAKTDSARTMKTGTIDCAATGGDGYCYISLVNKDPEKDVETCIRLDGSEADGVEKMCRIFAENLSACNTKDHPDEVAIKECGGFAAENGVIRTVLKKHSVTLFKVKMK